VTYPEDAIDKNKKLKIALCGAAAVPASLASLAVLLCVAKHLVISHE
jgi:hypothetical protein